MHLSLSLSLSLSLWEQGLGFLGDWVRTGGNGLGLWSGWVRTGVVVGGFGGREGLGQNWGKGFGGFGVVGFRACGTFNFKA
jgi:hypothetical protein